MQAKTIAVMLSCVIFGIVIELVRREKLTFKYAFGWMAISLVALFFSVFENVLFRLAHRMGFILPSNFVFFTLLCVIVFVSLLLTAFLCQQNTRNDIMAQKIGILENEIKKLKEKNSS